MAKREWIAICSNGAVALGAYEAGVLAQLYADVLEYNSKQTEVELGIDVIAGASAGAVTGTLLAQALVLRLSPSEFKDRVWSTWIKGLNIDDLLGNTDNGAYSGFDPSYLAGLAGRVLIPDADVVAGYEKLERKTEPVALWIALTNVDGIPYPVPFANVTAVASMYADYEPVMCSQGRAYRAPMDQLGANQIVLTNEIHWDAVAKVATTSGSFPFAFKSQELSRNLDEYPAIKKGLGPMKFSYVDGGVLNNNPLGRAIDAVSFQEKFSGHVEPHTFVVIDPDPTTPDQALQKLTERQAQDFSQTGLSVGSLAGAVISTYFNDALYRDLGDALKTNKRIAALDLALKGIAPEAADAIRKAVGYDFKKPLELQRIPGQGGRPNPLAGAFAGHFGGFFDERYRAYDFGIGCQEARAWFNEFKSSTPLSSAILHEPGPPLVPGGFHGIDPTALGHTKDKISNRAVKLADDVAKFGMMRFLANMVIKKFVRSELDSHL